MASELPRLDLQRVPRMALIDVARQMGYEEHPYRTWNYYVDQMELLSPFEFMDKWLSYNGIIGFTEQILNLYDSVAKSEKDRAASGQSKPSETGHSTAVKRKEAQLLVEALQLVEAFKSYLEDDSRSQRRREANLAACRVWIERSNDA